MKALEIYDINFSYDQHAAKAGDKSTGEAGEYALRNFTMSVETGDIHALLGPNGAGKTTLMRIITGQLRGYAGTVSIFGRPVTDKIALNSFGFAPQPISVFTALTARENLHFFGVMAGLPQERLQQRIREVLEQTGLSEYAEKLVAIYSGGMLRRLNLAVALLHFPRLLLLDEPTVGVDPQSRHHIYETLNKLNAEGMTILLCTHIMEEAQRLCSKVTLVDKGSVVFSGDMAGIDNLERFFLERTGHGLRDECEL
jgi:ABC-2 type transport system ATP-binding protein